MMIDCGEAKRNLYNYLERTWLIHKEKFVKAWTNKVLHFGNTTTCRVESAHNALKKWLATSTGSIDSVFEKVHLEIDSQISGIRYLLISKFIIPVVIYYLSIR